MATSRRDYYELLGVAVTADEGEIKKAFRRLARTLHPDVSEEPDAEERFREVVEAYEVLSKSETRELYDRYGHDGLRGGGFTPTTFDLGSLADLFGAFFGDDLFGMGGRARSGRGADVVAQMYEISESTVRQHVFRARRTLRARLEPLLAPGKGEWADALRDVREEQ